MKPLLPKYATMGLLTVLVLVWVFYPIAVSIWTILLIVTVCFAMGALWYAAWIASTKK
ncbi:hypothetical protein KA005_62395 [bacterium]|nr:hypothetical protein [bacterium]